MSNIKKLSALLLVSIIAFSFSSCDTNFLNKILPGNYDASFGKRPDYFPNTKWVSEEPNIWFEVIEEVNDIGESNNVIKGEIYFEDEKLNFEAYFDMGIGFNIIVEAEDYEYNKTIKGLCSFYSDKLIVEIEEDFVFNNKYEQITFYKINDDLSESSNN